jgi:hypothetical protein
MVASLHGHALMGNLKSRSASKHHGTRRFLVVPALQLQGRVLTLHLVKRQLDIVAHAGFFQNACAVGTHSV